MHREYQSKKQQTIQKQILKGYFFLTGVIALLVIISILFLRINEYEYARIIAFQEQQRSAQQVITAHYQWLEQLSDAITTESEFKGSLDPDHCALGQWIASAEADVAKYPEIKQALDGIIQPHREIHTQAAELVKLSKTSRDEAYIQYGNKFKPKVETIGNGLNQISAAYQGLSDKIERSSTRTALLSNTLVVLIGLLAVAISLLVGRKVAMNISEPILMVAKWSEEFATGVENLRLDEADTQSEDSAVEIARMMDAFKIMANSIRENVKVIQKVAQGDLTAFVDIRSSGDSLGQNLYHLVQNNDFMFSRMLNIADSVAQSAEHIAHASQELALSSGDQANAVEMLTCTMEQANALAEKNAQSAQNATMVINGMGEDIRDGQVKMDALLQSVKEIQAASSKISLVLKSINDIAFQTNILALNASVEAARAGMAGKGFAVVADEVRNLALKSSEAAERSRTFIEDTIAKANEGGKISKEASETFDLIVGRAVNVADVVEDIHDASNQQQEYIMKIYDEIYKISAAVTQNAATSEETAAATQEMTGNAEIIRKEMQQFNLRKREHGKAYIPPEKANDDEFIRLANENYQKALRQGNHVKSPGLEAGAQEEKGNIKKSR